MANVTISGGPPNGLPDASLPLDGTERVAMDKGAETVNATTADVAATLPDATDSVAGKMSAADKAKLDAVEAGATANATDADLRDRTTHTGVQAISTVTGLQTALDGKATTAQGALADTAVQPGDLATVATTGVYGDLSGLPTLGTAAATASTDYATAAQGATADSAVQPGDLATVATTGAYGDLSGLPTLGTAASAASTDFAAASHTQAASTITDFNATTRGQIESALIAGANVTITPAGSGATRTFTIASTASGGGGGTVTNVAATVPTGFVVTGSPITTTGTLAFAFDAGYSLPTDADQANWDTAFSERLRWDGGATGLNAATGRVSLGLGTAALSATGDFATAAQGALADSATQPGDLATVATTGVYADLSGLPTLGTASALNVGTGAANVVQLDGSGRLPAVDASQLTNLPGGGGNEVTIDSVEPAGPATADIWLVTP
jgi:hypothetical protein